MTSKHGTGKYERLLVKCRKLEPVPTAVAHPCEKTALCGAVEAGEKGLIRSILVGPGAKIEAVAKAAGVDLGKLQIVDTPHSQASATKAVALVREGQAELLSSPSGQREAAFIYRKSLSKKYRIHLIHLAGSP
jgi:phosphate acetyltransferase